MSRHRAIIETRRHASVGTRWQRDDRPAARRRPVLVARIAQCRDGSPVSRRQASVKAASQTPDARAVVSKTPGPTRAKTRPAPGQDGRQASRQQASVQTTCQCRHEAAAGQQASIETESQWQQRRQGSVKTAGQCHDARASERASQPASSHQTTAERPQADAETPGQPATQAPASRTTRPASRSQASLQDTRAARTLSRQRTNPRSRHQPTARTACVLFCFSLPDG